MGIERFQQLHDGSTIHVIDPSSLTSEEDVKLDTLTSAREETLYDKLERDPALLAREFAIRLIELADEFDNLDHQYRPPMAGSELQDYARTVKDLARSWEIPGPSTPTGP